VGVKLLAQLDYVGGESLDTKDAVTIQRQAEHYLIRVNLPNIGNYLLRLFAKRSGESGSYHWVLDYSIIRTR